MTTETHLAPDEAAQYAANLLDPTVRARVDAHIDDCADCRELLSAIARAAITTLDQRLRGVETGSIGNAPTAQSAQILPKGTQVGAYELEQPLGAGGMGMVYLGFDTRLRRQVALKCVRDRGGGTKDQLLHEARLMAQLAHPNVVAVYDVVEAHSQFFVAMELVSGRTLREWLEGGVRPWRQVVDHFLEAGRGLAAAHQAGMIHGDVKPANMLLGDDGRVRVTDFGLASVGLDSSGAIRGTQAYMSPEQRSGAPCDQLSDQYAFGVSLYEAVYGALPGQPAKFQARVPRSVRQVIDRALARSPTKRFRTMNELLRALSLARLGRWRYVVAAVAVLAIFAASSFGIGGRQATLTQCQALADQLDSPWTSETRAAARTAFERLELSYANETFQRIDRDLDGWTKGYDDAKARACQATWFAREASPALPRQLACLGQAATDARALITQLVDADAALVIHAVGAVQQLPVVSRCFETNDAVAVPKASAAARAVSEQIAKTRAFAASGKFTAALPEAVAAARAAEESKDPTLIAQSQALLGGIQGLVGKYDEADKTLREAIRLAERAQEDRARALAWADLLALSSKRGRPDDVLVQGPLALGAAERIRDRRLITDVMSTVGSALSEKGRTDEARAMLEEAVRQRVEAFGERDRRTSDALSTLANAMAMSGDLPRAIDAHRRALSAAEESYGSAHPETAIIRLNLGDDHLYGLEAAKAATLLSSAAEALRAAVGPKSREANLATTDLGFALLLQGKAAEALATFEAAIAVWADAYPTHPTYALALLGRHQASLALGQPARVDDLEKAITLSGDLPPFEHGRVELALGLAINDATRAKTLVRSSVTHLDSAPLPLIVEEKRRAEAWLSKH